MCTVFLLGTTQHERTSHLAFNSIFKFFEERLNQEDTSENQIDNSDGDMVTSENQAGASKNEEDGSENQADASHNKEDSSQSQKDAAENQTEDSQMETDS